MIRRMLFLLMVCLAPLAATAEPRPHGLMWNRSGLPLTLPLLVKSDPGQDHYLRLLPVTGGDPVMAAYVRGGQFFRVLVPPGDYHVNIASGKVWQDETALFGPDTESRTLPEVLNFGVRGYRTRGGQMIDLRSQQQEVRAFDLCPAGAVLAMQVPADPVQLTEMQPAPAMPPRVVRPDRTLPRIPTPGVTPAQRDPRSIAAHPPATLPRGPFDRDPQARLPRLEAPAQGLPGPAIAPLRPSFVLPGAAGLARVAGANVPKARATRLLPCD